MQQYELLFVVPGTLSEEEIAPLVAGVEETVKKYGGAELSIHDLGKSRLAYPIQYIRYGYFRICYFSAEPQAAAMIQQKLDLMNQILRAIIHTFDPRKQAKKTGQILSDVALAALREEAKREGNTARGTAEIVHTIPAAPPRPLPAPATEEVRTTEAIDLKDIDKQLDEILDRDLTKV